MNKKGFTIIELVIVLALLGMMLTMVSYFYRDARVSQTRVERLTTHIYDVLRNAKNNMLIGRGEMSGGVLTAIDAKIVSLSPTGIISQYKQGTQIVENTTESLRSPYYDNDPNYKIAEIAVSTGSTDTPWYSSGSLDMDIIFGPNGEITSASGTDSVGAALQYPVRTLQIKTQYQDAIGYILLDRSTGTIEIIKPGQSTRSASNL